LPTAVLPSRSHRIIFAALLGFALSPGGAMAHAILVQSQPAAGCSVPAGKMDMSFSYNSRIDRARSRLTLTSPDHSLSVLKIGPAGPPNVLATGTNLTTPGAYVLHWQVLAVDGHITRGELPFTVTGQ
jgi:copper resistance protein C